LWYKQRIFGGVLTTLSIEAERVKHVWGYDAFKIQEGNNKSDE